MGWSINTASRGNRSTRGRLSGRIKQCLRGGVRRLGALVAAGSLAGSGLAPVAAVTATVAAVAAVNATAAVVPAQAAATCTGSVLVFPNSVNGGSSAAEAVEAASLGCSVTIFSASVLSGMTQAQQTTYFATFTAIIVGDPSTSTTCATTVPSDALTYAAEWGPAVTGNIAVIGTAPVLGSGTTLMDDAITYAVSGGSTGLYASLDCDYSSASAGTSVPLLAEVDGGGFTVIGQQSKCPDTGSVTPAVNTWLAVADTDFNGLDNANLGPWSSPACSASESFNAWPSGLQGLAYLAGATPSTFTASDGNTGQAYVLAGAPVSAATAALSLSANGQVALTATAGGGQDPAAPGVVQDSSNGVNTEDGDYSTSSTDFSLPTFGPPLDFTRTYDALTAQQQEQAGTPGPLGYGWTDDWTSTLSSSSAVVGDMYSLDGLADPDGNGGIATQGPLDYPDMSVSYGGNIYISDTAGNRIEEIAGSTGPQWGISMTSGDMYTIAGSPTGAYGTSQNGTPDEAGVNGATSSSLFDQPEGIALDPSGNLYFADTGNNRIIELAASTGTQWGSISMTANDLYVVAGNPGGSIGHSGDGGLATSAFLDGPVGIKFGHSTSDLYIADAGNSRIQEIPATSNSGQWGHSAMTADDIYTIAGSQTGLDGTSSNGTAAGSSLLTEPEDLSFSSAGDMYISDTGNNRIVEIPASGGGQWGFTSMTADDLYTVAGSQSGTSGLSGDGGPSTSAKLDLPVSVMLDNGGQMYISDSGNNRIQEVASTRHTERGVSMTQYDIYTIAGSSSGTAGFSGDGGVATSALLDNPGQVAFDGSINMYIPDTGNNREREVSESSGDISEFAGDGQTLASMGDNGPAVDGELFSPAAQAEDALGDIYIADASNNRIQEISASSHYQWGTLLNPGIVYTIAGSKYGLGGYSGDGSSATSALLNDPMGVAVDAAGNVFIADTGNSVIREVSASTGHISTIAGTGTAGTASSGVAAISADLDAPMNIALDSAGDVFIAGNGVSVVQEIYASGGQSYGQSMTAGDIYTIAGTGLNGSSGDGGAATSAELNEPEGVTVDNSGDVYIADSFNNRIQEIPVTGGTEWGQSMTADHIYTIAGSASGLLGDTGDGGPAASALLSRPVGLAIDTAGDLFIADAKNNRVQEVADADGSQWGQPMTADYMYTVAGSPTGVKGESGDGGPATGTSGALMSYAQDVSVDSAGDLYITDWAGNHLREVPATTAVTITPAPGLTSALYPAPSGITITQPGGAQVTYYSAVGGSCAALYVTAGQYCALPQNLGSSLTLNGGTGIWTFTPQPGTTYTYKPDGQLLSESDAASDTLSIGYGEAPGSGLCPTSASSCQVITAANGRAITLGDNGSGLITTATDPMGRQWTYAYNSSDELTSATDPMNHVTTYGYDTSNANPLLVADLTVITQSNGQPGGPDAGTDTAIAYNPAGQVTSTTDPMGYQTTYAYAVNPATGTGIGTFTSPGGSAHVDYYSQGTLAAQSAWSGAVGASAVSEQDAVPDQTMTSGDNTAGSELDVAGADATGHISTTSYSAAGDPTVTIAPDGIGSQDALTTAQYTSLNQANCTTDVITSSTCSAVSPPPPVTAGGVITPPSSAPPEGVTLTLYDNDGNELWTSDGVYNPGSSTAAFIQTTYQLFKGNSVTLPGSSTAISCGSNPPSQSLPCATIDADGVVTQLQYNRYGDLMTASTPDGNGTELATTSYGYDGDGEQTSETSPDGNVSGANAGNFTTVTAYNSDSEETSVTEGGGSGATVTPRTTTYGYDGDGNQTAVTDARNYTTNTAYNADDESALVTDPDGNQTLTCYDGDGNVTQTVPPVGVAANNLTASSCPASYPAGYNPSSHMLAADATMSAFNSLDQQTASYTPAPAGQSGYETTTYTYDANGNLAQTTAPPATSGGQNQVTVDYYTSTGQVASETTGYGTSAASTTTYCYDPDGTETAVTYGDGNTSNTAPCESSYPWVINATSYPTQASYQTTYAYDSAGDQVSTTTPATVAAPSGATASATYDPDGNELTSTDPNGVTTTWTYTALDQAATVNYSGGSAHSVTYGHDASGSTTSMSDATGTSSYAYDPFGELTSATNGAGQTVSYGYNLDGGVTGITYPLLASATWASTDTVSYAYDHADQMTSATDFNGNQIGISSTADGLQSSETLGSSGDTISTTYDNTDSPSLIALKNGSITRQSFGYSDSQAGTILTETDSTPPAQTQTAYAYDAAGDLTSMTPGSGPAKTYGFDASSNLTTLPGGALGIYDHAGELAASNASGTTTSYTYNADGEQLSAVQGSTTISSGTWNGAEELTSASDGAANMTAASYDGNGLRASATAGSTTQNFTWDTETGNAQTGVPGGPSPGGSPQLLMDSSNAYIYTGGITPAEQVSLSAGAITYLLADSLGSVRGTVNNSGTLTGTTSYDAFGNPATSGGLTASTPFGYAGGYTDPTGLIYSVNRYYDPGTGQFISVDPDLIDTQAAYAYAGADPVTGTDPTGLNVKAKKCKNGQSSGGALKVQFCLLSNKTFSGGRWYAEATATATSGGPLKEIGATWIGLATCHIGAKCKTTVTHKESHVTGQGAHPTIDSHILVIGCQEWITMYVKGLWAKSKSGVSTKAISFHNQTRKTCHGEFLTSSAGDSGDSPDYLCFEC